MYYAANGDVSTRLQESVFIIPNLGPLQWGFSLQLAYNEEDVVNLRVLRRKLSVK